MLQSTIFGMVITNARLPLPQQPKASWPVAARLIFGRY